MIFFSSASHAPRKTRTSSATGLAAGTGASAAAEGADARAAHAGKEAASGAAANNKDIARLVLIAISVPLLALSEEGLETYQWIGLWTYNWIEPKEAYPRTGGCASLV